MMTTKRTPGSMIAITARRTTGRPTRLTSFTRMTNTFTSDIKRTTRKPLTTLKAGGDVNDDTNVDHQISGNMFNKVLKHSLVNPTRQRYISTK